MTKRRVQTPSRVLPVHLGVWDPAPHFLVFVDFEWSFPAQSNADIKLPEEDAKRCSFPSNTWACHKLVAADNGSNVDELPKATLNSFRIVLVH